jgi:hypothetical protein
LIEWEAHNLFCARSTVAIESCACDNYKVILLMCEQLMFLDRIQKEDILAIIRHELEAPHSADLPTYRPEAPQSWWDNWTSDDFYTQTDTKVEYFAADCFKVIHLMCMQFRHFDKLSNEHILAVISEDIDRHFVEEDVA